MEPSFGHLTVATKTPPVSRSSRALPGAHGSMYRWFQPLAVMEQSNCWLMKAAKSFPPKTPETPRVQNGSIKKATHEATKSVHRYTDILRYTYYGFHFSSTWMKRVGNLETDSKWKLSYLKTAFLN